MPVLLHKHYLFGSVFALVLCTPVAADNEEAIAHCAKIASVGDRILCLENALRPTTGDAAEIQGAKKPAIQEAAPAMEEIIESEDEPIEAAVESVESRHEPALDELGIDQVAPRQTTKPEHTPRLKAEVVAFDFVGRDRLRVRLSNGQVWRQTDADRPNLTRPLRTADDFPVELWQARSGGYRMRILSLDKTIRVQRIK